MGTPDNQMSGVAAGVAFAWNDLEALGRLGLSPNWVGPGRGMISPCAALSLLSSFSMVQWSRLSGSSCACSLPLWCAAGVALAWCGLQYVVDASGRLGPSPYWVGPGWGIATPCAALSLFIHFGLVRGTSALCSLISSLVASGTVLAGCCLQYAVGASGRLGPSPHRGGPGQEYFPPCAALSLIFVFL